jgi:hypothetical protein
VQRATGYRGLKMKMLIHKLYVSYDCGLSYSLNHTDAEIDSQSMKNAMADEHHLRNYIETEGELTGICPIHERTQAMLSGIAHEPVSKGSTMEEKVAMLRTNSCTQRA